jgi:hypothetical protein
MFGHEGGLGIELYVFESKRHARYRLWLRYNISRFLLWYKEVCRERGDLPVL